MGELVAAILRPDVIGLLDRDVTVAVAEISRGGCLLESSSMIVPGTLASLSVEIEGKVYADDVRVVRCWALPGCGDRHHVGVEFLPLRRPGQESLRMYAASLGNETLHPRGALALRFRSAS